ncbi:MAG TPA: AIR synthase-related protein, partial [Ilumatobacteraceae bacterium]|nr:AIR synthase-related protein [Ilumatobacteraceae bacterium]
VAVKGCCDAAVAHDAPFVSGKDSLNNEYLGSDGQRHAVPPTLVITAVAHVPDAARAVTPDLKQAGHALVLVGRTASEFGGSHFQLVHGGSRSAVPAPDPDAPERHRRLHAALATGRVVACHDLSEGGLGVALAEMAIAGRLGARIDTLPHADATTAWFSESTGRFVCEMADDDVDWFTSQLGADVVRIGTVVDEPAVVTPTWSVALDELRAAFAGQSEVPR